MVFHARLTTNIRDIVRDPADQVHRVTYSGNFARVQDCFPGSHTLDISTGELFLGNIQCPERPVVKAIGGYHRFTDNKSIPDVIPNKREFYSFSTLFELERLAKDPIVTCELKSLNADVDREIEQGGTYFQEQKTALDQFMEGYARAVSNSPLQKPVLEGFYEALKRWNVQSLLNAERPEINELIRGAYKRKVFQEDDFASAFGRNIYQQLREILGEPKFV
ncbi:MAG TPA: hypothetical protein VJI32_02065 [Candidatus Nanoarchaeia archaeon]|nr:hypothetical protein [Candidatus Nanoarchaeia archaeon]